MMVSYADKKKKGHKIVILLSTLDNEMRVSKDLRAKPQPIVYYDHAKGGVDVVDLVSANMLTRFKTRHWPINTSAYMLDIVQTIALTLLWEVNNKPMYNFEFTYALTTFQLCSHTCNRKFTKSWVSGMRYRYR